MPCETGLPTCHTLGNNTKAPEVTLEFPGTNNERGRDSAAENDYQRGKIKVTDVTLSLFRAAP
jgi:hypothetical protein